MNRRGFLKRGGLLGAVLAGASVPAQASSPSEELVQQLESNGSNITFVNSYNTEPVERMRINADGTFNIGTIAPQRSLDVVLKPGPDGNLYIKTNNTWKKV